mgnify:FL=1
MDYCQQRRFFWPVDSVRSYGVPVVSVRIRVDVGNLAHRSRIAAGGLSLAWLAGRPHLWDIDAGRIFRGGRYHRGADKLPDHYAADLLAFGDVLCALGNRGGEWGE